MRTLRHTLLAVALLGSLGAWLFVLWTQRSYQEGPNYSLIEPGLYLGGSVPQPPPGTTFRFAPGQFGWFTFGRSPYSLTQHPFSFSGSAERDDAELAVICPMCGMGRVASIDTCTNCGLVLKVKTTLVPVRSTTGAKPGGAAAA